jgi:hypothetical protein
LKTQLRIYLGNGNGTFKLAETQKYGGNSFVARYFMRQRAVKQQNMMGQFALSIGQSDWHRQFLRFLKHDQLSLDSRRTNRLLYRGNFTNYHPKGGLWV